MGGEKALLLSDTRRSISNTPSYLVNTPMCILGPQKYKTPAKIRTKVFRFVRTQETSLWLCITLSTNFKTHV